MSYDEVLQLAKRLDPHERERLARFRGIYRRLRRQADRLGAAATLRSLVEGVDLERVLAGNGQQNMERRGGYGEQGRGIGPGFSHAFIIYRVDILSTGIA